MHIGSRVTIRKEVRHLYPELFGLHLITSDYEDFPFNGGLYHIKSHDIWLWQNELQEIPTKTLNKNYVKNQNNQNRKSQIHKRV